MGFTDCNAKRSGDIIQPLHLNKTGNVLLWYLNTLKNSQREGLPAETKKRQQYYPRHHNHHDENRDDDENERE